MSMCRQIDGCENNVSEAVVGTKGTLAAARAATASRSPASGSRIRGQGGQPLRPGAHRPDREHPRGQAAQRAASTVAESTLTAIMGRMSAYTGKAVTWEQALNSKLDLLPENLELGALPSPAGRRARARPS